MSNNLFSKNTSKIVASTAISEPNKWWYQNTNGKVFRIPCKANTEYTLSVSSTINNTLFRISTIDNDNIPSGTYGNYETVTDITKSGAIHSYTFTTNSSAKYILFQINADYVTDAINSLMLNYGDTALPYEVGDYDWQLNNDILIINAIPSLLPYDYAHKNLSDWYLNTKDMIENDIIPIRINWVKPYPLGKWYIDENNILQCSGVPEPLNWEKPYPASYWYYDEELGYLMNAFMPMKLIIPPSVVGAFQNCRNLHFVKIPRSVTEIGQSSFEGTALTKVCISRNCVYSPSSFPDGCEVIYYEDLYSINYNEYVEGPNAFRSTEIIPFDESSEEQPEIP